MVTTHKCKRWEDIEQLYAVEELLGMRGLFAPSLNPEDDLAIFVREPKIGLRGVQGFRHDGRGYGVERRQGLRHGS